MKRLYILLTLLVAAANLAAQTDGYKPFVEEGKRWVCYSTSMNSKSDNISYLIEGDSVVAGRNYKIVWSVNSRNQKALTALVREEGSRVYIIDYEDVEKVLYDFSDPSKSEYHGPVTFLPTTRQGRSGFVSDDSEFMVIEGIGLDAASAGTPFNPTCDFLTCACYNYLDHVEDAQGNVVYYGKGYMQPLVREGVVWHYAYRNVPEGFPFDDEQITLSNHKVEFRGDTIIGGQEYKKCYLYETEQLDPSVTEPVAFMREKNGIVRVIYDDLSTYRSAEKPYSYTSDENNDNDERVIYDFFNFFLLIETACPSEYPVIETVGEVQLGDLPVPVHKYQFKDYIDVEGVGADSPMSGYLFDPYPPLPTCICSMPLGLIKLEDSDGKLLHKGHYYDEYYSSVRQVDAKTGLISFDGRSLRVTGQGVVDVINTSGAVVGHHSVSSATATISTADLPSGIYLVQLSTATGRQTKKIVIP